MVLRRMGIVNGGEHMSDDWDTISFVIRSQYRVNVLSRLVEGPATPSRIAADEDIAIAHVSRALSGLREDGRGMVELLVSEDQKKGRVYGITEKGESVWERLETENMV
jgi:DNA-binding MarR family transcriptional regulator